MKVPNKVLNAISNICNGLAPADPQAAAEVELVANWAREGIAKRAAAASAPKQEEKDE
jgi:hypothetical protein